MLDLPTGTVTLLFTDIEGSTLLLQHVGKRYSDVLDECRYLLRAAVQQWGGHEVDTQGDGFFAVFARASDAVSAAGAAQRAIASHAWPEGVVVRVRMGMHTGEPQRAAEGYVGLDVHHAARIMSAGHGGQVLLSRTTQQLVEHSLPEGMSLRDLGEHRLKDLQHPSHLFQLVIADLPADFPPLKTLDTHPHNLPIQPTPLIGREREIGAVQQLLQRENVRLLTLSGPGGSGKTRLGLQVAAELSERFADGIYFVNLAPISDPDLVIPTIAQTCELKEAGATSLLNLLKATFRDKHLLLLLDNFEQVLPAAPRLADLLTSCPHLNILVTSRAALHVQGEHEFPIPPLTLPDLTHLPPAEALSGYAAVALFVSRAQAAKPTFQLTSTNAHATAEICVRLDGLPLAIELAAARIKLLPPQALLTRLEHRLTLLTCGVQDAPVRQQTLRNTLAWSYDLLSPQEQRLFRQLSVFVGGCTLEAVEAVCNTLSDEKISVLEGVASLLDKSLVQQAGREWEEEPRFVLLETIREYGLECLESSGELEATRAAHAAYYLALAEQGQPYLQGAEQTRWFARLEQERENLRTTLSWLLERARMEVQTKDGREQAEAERALRLCVALFPFWYNRWYFKEAWSFLEQALDLRENVVAPLRARVLYNAGFLLWHLDDLVGVEALTGESLTLYRELGDTAGVGHALTLLGAVAWLRGQYAVARALDEEAAALLQQVGDTWGRGRCLTDLARMATAQGEYERARALLEESLALYRALDDKQRIGWVLYLLARMLFESQSDLARAAVLAEQSLALQREIGAQSFTFEPLRLLGEIRLAQGEQARARERAEECVAICKEVGSEWYIAKALMCLARVIACQNDLAMARALYQESFALLHKGGNKDDIAPCLEGLGVVVSAQGSGEAPYTGAHWAAQLFGAAETLRQRIGTPLAPVYRTDYEQAVAAVRSALGEKAFAEAMAEGRTMTPEQAFAAQGQRY